MTDKPTDTEIDAFVQVCREKGMWELAIFQAVLDKWGQPAHSEGVAVHQFRKQHCADWYDGRADHDDGGGPYEERVLYTAPQPVDREPTSEAQVFTALRGVDSLDALVVWRAAEQYHNIKGGQHADT